MKKLLTGLFLSVLVLALAACGAGKKKTMQVQVHQQMIKQIVKKM